MRLIDVCEFIVDCPHSTSPDEGTGFPLIRTPNIGKGRLILENVHKVSEKVYHARTSRAVPQDDDLIFAREAPAGNIAIIKNGAKVCLGQRTVLIRPDRTKVFPDFLVYYMLAPQQQHNLLKFASGATVPHVNLPDIRNLHISLPSYSAQQKIAGILSAYDDLIENNQKQIQLLEEAAQRLYKEWFVDLRFPGHENTRIVDGVPEGWEVCTIDDICSLRKTALKAQNIPPGIPYIGLEHIPRKDFCLSSWGNSSAVSSTKYQYKENDILFGKIRPYFHKVGFCINSGVTSTDTIVMTAKNDSLWPILLLSVFSKDFVNYSYQNCKEGSKMPRADWNIMKNYKILNPEKTILEKFNNNIFRMTKKIKILAHQNNIISETRNMLLPKLMKEI
ncbi:restriction endonuclease subunit S [uncultured Desulfovibrio sp.]|uniref:restriction endonuclease subunit S n=1 Tax=uncultured Desulfovibrio sp. TaxID=167968 RepID=UPI003208111C